MKKRQIIAIVGIVLGLVITCITVGLIKTKDIKTYIVTFDTNGGSVIEKQVINEGEKVIKPKDPAKEGFDFIEWTYDGKIYDFSLSVTSDIVLKAKWLEHTEEIETFVVKFNSDGGTTIANQIIPKDGLIEKPMDPIKKGYKFIGWYLDDVLFSFEETVSSDIELIAKWEKTKTSNNKKEDNNQVSSTNKNEQTESDNKQNNNSGSTPSEVKKLPTPKIRVAEMGGVNPDNGDISTYLQLEEVQGSVEIYYSENKDTGYKLLRTAKRPDEGNDCYEVTIPLGKRYYYKVRLAANGEYSEYSNVVDYDNSLITPKIRVAEMGGIDPDNGTEFTYLQLEEVQGTVEIYYATSATGEYKLLKAKETTDGYEIEIPLGKHYYYKVRLTANGEYSKYSNVVDYDNSLVTPKITVAEMGGVNPDNGEISTYLQLEEVQGTVEIYYSESKDTGYKLLRTAEKPDEGSNCYEITIPLGKHYYFKVRLKANNEYSNFSNVVDYDNN